MEKRNKKGLILDESYDQMKDMLNLSRRLHEQVDDIEIDVETVKEEKTKEYAVGGSSIIVHGVTDKDLNNIEWSGKLVRFDLEFFYSIGESNGIYINGTMIKVDEDLYGMLDKLKTYYKTFSTKWSQILSERKGSVEPSADSSEAESEEDKQIGDVPL